MRGEGEELRAEAHFPLAVLLHQLVQRLHCRGAVRALIVAELHDRDRTLPQHRAIVGAHLHPAARREGVVVLLHRLHDRGGGNAFAGHVLDQLGHAQRVRIGLARRQALRQCVLAARVDDELGGGIDEYRPLRVGQAGQVGARDDAFRLLLAERALLLRESGRGGETEGEKGAHGGGFIAFSGPERS